MIFESNVDIFTFIINQGLPISQGDPIDESSGNWESVFIPISDLQIENKFSARTTYTLKNLQSGAVYDIVAKAKNKYGWSEQSKTFNFFNKGVGKYHRFATNGF